MSEREDIVVSPLLQALLNELASDLLQEFGSEWDVEGALDELSDVLANIQAMLLSPLPLEMLQIRDPLLKRYLYKLRDLAYDVHVLLDEFIYQRRLVQNETHHHHQNRGRRRVCKSFSFTLNSNQELQQHEIAPLIGEFKEKLLQIDNNLKPIYSVGMEKWLKCIQLQYYDTRQKSGSLIAHSHVVGREEDVNVVIKNILFSSVSEDQYINKQREREREREVPVIAIVGMGGLGKTTLAQLVFNHQDVDNHFDLRSWVCVSLDFNVQRLARTITESVTDFNVESLTRAIIESVTGKRCKVRKLEQLQLELLKVIKGKKFLLVLDDVWNESHASWEALRIPFRFAEKGSRILITTRSMRVSSIMSTIYRHDLQSLSDEDCWSLIKARASLDENCISFPDLKAIGRKIAEKCKGLPLAANAFGCLLGSRLDENIWQDILQSYQWNNILPALSVSYHCLSQHLKQCFAYCSLFPKYYEFDKEKLIRMWMGEGFILSKQVDIMEDIGCQYFDDLLAKSFFQKCPGEDETKFVVHDLIHELAESVSGKQCLRVDKSFQKCSISLSKEARRVSIFTKEIDSVDLEFFRYKSASTFLSVCVYPNLFQELRWLRVLDLSGNGIDTLPNSIGELKHLRYLDLSENNIKVLPESMCKLYNLQTLDLRGCLIYSIPMGTQNLVNLQHLIIDSFYIGDMPPKIGRLTYLKTLLFFNVGQTEGCRIGELKELRHLEGKLTIWSLENVVNVEDAIEANLKNKPKLRQLELCWGKTRPENPDGYINILEGLQPHTELKDFRIRNYDGSRFPNWMMTSLLDYNKLVAVTLEGCSRCEYLPPLGRLPLLESLVIGEMRNVKQLGSDFYRGSRKRFQSLQTLTVYQMNNLRKWYGAEEGEFPCLKKLDILYCENLKEIPPLLPTVKILAIHGCNKLTALPCLLSISELNLSICEDRILSQVHRCTSLSSLCISRFSDLTTLPPNMLIPLARTLESFKLYECKKLESLSDAVGLQHLARLKHLEIYGCPNLRSLPEELHNLISLMEIKVQKCPNLTSMPKGLHNLISLTDLVIKSTSEQLLSFLNEKDSLPLKLTRLSISSYKNLKYLPTGLCNLSSLQELDIRKCRNLQSLPKDGFPTSLQLLKIYEINDDLKRRCEKGNEDWPKIAHIPHTEIR